MNYRGAIIVAILLVAGWVAFGGGLPIGSPPPFKTDKLAVLVIEETDEHSKYTADQLNVIQATDSASVKVLVESKGGQFQVIDHQTKDGLPWVMEALAVERKSLPWVVAATPSSGFSEPMPAEADLKTKIGGLR